MMPSRTRTRTRSVWLGLTALLGITFTLAFAETLHAQVLSDPRVAEFDPSPDHWTMLENGEPAVLRYALEVYLVGASVPLGTVDMGKPSPDSDGKIRYDFASQVTGWALPGSNYEARVSAVGPEGAALSNPSNPFTFTNSSSCTLSLSAQIVSASASGGSHAVNVSTGEGCRWTASTALAWVTIWTAGGSGGGTVSFEVQANSSSSSRAGTITVGDQTLEVWQAGAPPPCSYIVSPGLASVPAAGGSASFTVTAGTGCAWTAAAAQSWTVVAGGSGSGNGTVSVTVAANTSTSNRTGTVSVQGQTFTITQAGAAPDCSYGVSPTSASVPATGGSGEVTVSTGSGCTWAVVSSQTWLVPAATGGTGNARFAFTVKSNNGTASRSAKLTVGPWAVTVSQSGKPRRTK